jgi:hypothetical protein
LQYALKPIRPILVFLSWLLGEKSIVAWGLVRESESWRRCEGIR